MGEYKKGNLRKLEGEVTTRRFPLKNKQRIKGPRERKKKGMTFTNTLPLIGTRPPMVGMIVLPASTFGVVCENR